MFFTVIGNFKFLSFQVFFLGGGEKLFWVFFLEKTLFGHFRDPKEIEKAICAAVFRVWLWFTTNQTSGLSSDRGWRTSQRPARRGSFSLSF